MVVLRRLRRVVGGGFDRREISTTRKGVCCCSATVYRRAIVDLKPTSHPRVLWQQEFGEYPSLIEGGPGFSSEEGGFVASGWSLQFLGFRCVGRRALGIWAVLSSNEHGGGVERQPRPATNANKIRFDSGFYPSRPKSKYLLRGGFRSALRCDTFAMTSLAIPITRVRR